MELKDFIKGVIEDIEGAKNDIAKSIDKEIRYGKNENGGYGIDFDLMVINEEGQKGKGQGGIKVLGASIGGELEGNNKVVNTNRINFSITIQDRIKTSSLGIKKKSFR